MAQSIIRKSSTYSVVRILDWGTYNTVNQTYTLSDSIRNYDFLSIRCSSDTDQTSGGGAQFAIIPVWEISNTSQFGVKYALNGSEYLISVSFPTNTQMKILTTYDLTGKTSNVVAGIRDVIGIRC